MLTEVGSTCADVMLVTCHSHARIAVLCMLCAAYADKERHAAALRYCISLLYLIPALMPFFCWCMLPDFICQQTSHALESTCF